jgi:hypothetical protein
MSHRITPVLIILYRGDSRGRHGTPQTSRGCIHTHISFECVFASVHLCVTYLGRAHLSGQFLECDLAVCKIFAVPHQLRTRLLLASLLDFLPVGVPFRMSLSGALVLDEYMTASHLHVQGNPEFRFDSHTEYEHLLACQQQPNTQSRERNCNATCTASIAMDGDRVQARSQKSLNWDQ